MQRRSQCQSCRREWVFSTVESPTCLFCGGEVLVVTFRPIVRGLDIGTTEADLPCPVKDVPVLLPAPDIGPAELSQLRIDSFNWLTSLGERL